MFMTYWSIDPLLISEQLLRVSLKARQNMIPLEISYSEKVLKKCHALISLDVNTLFIADSCFRGLFTFKPSTRVHILLPNQVGR